jgi:hypothetical protein
VRIEPSKSPRTTALDGEMSNLAIQRTATEGATGMLPPGMDADYALVRQLPLFEGVGTMT